MLLEKLTVNVSKRRFVKTLELWRDSTINNDIQDPYAFDYGDPRMISIAETHSVRMYNSYLYEVINQVYDYELYENQIENIFDYDFSIHSCELQEYKNEECEVQRSFEGENCNVDGVPSEFITSFGSYIGLKFFLDGVKDKKDVFTQVNKFIDENTFNSIKELFGNCRHIYNGNITSFEFFDPNLGYVIISKDSSLRGKLKINTSVGYDKLNDIISLAKEIKDDPTAKWVTGIDSSGDLVTKELSINNINEYNPVFYPFMKGKDMKEFAEEFLNSKSSILVLIGPPGTSKTNFIRQLLGSTSESVLLTYSEKIKEMDTLFSYFYDSPEKFLIIEDADTYIEKREDGNTNMKQLLNITDGLTANPNKKVIFSTNLPSLNNVDQALIRPGRCFDCLEFNRLTGDDLNNAIEYIGKEHFSGLSIPSIGFTVAELFAIKNGERIDMKEITNRFGFNS